MLGAGYVDLVARVHGLPVWQYGATALDSNQLCSLPSLHIAWATWCSIAVWNMTARRWLRALAVVYPLLTTYAVMATGNHYPARRALRCSAHRLRVLRAQPPVSSRQAGVAAERGRRPDCRLAGAGLAV